MVEELDQDINGTVRVDEKVSEKVLLAWWIG
jgi:hypothetical protein